MASAIRTLFAVIVVSCLAVSTLAHNGEPRPAPAAPPPPVYQPTRTYKPVRWSWVHWWEANRDRFLQPQDAQKPVATTEPVATTQQAPATQESDPLRIQATRLLLDIIDKSDNEALVEQATLAIGKIQYRTAIPLLGAEAQKSKSQRIRRAALVALGLIGGPEAEIQILAFNPQTLDDRLAAITALGLLPTLQDSTMQSLRDALQNAAQAPTQQQQTNTTMNGVTRRIPLAVADAQTATTICWALRQHHVAANVPFYQQLVWTSESPWISSEAITALGEAPESTPQLSDILIGGTKAVNSVAAWNVLDFITRQKASIYQRGAKAQQVYDQSFKDYQKRFSEFQQKNPNSPVKQQQKQQGRMAPIIWIGEEQILIENLRSSAAIALGHTQRDDARDGLMQFLEPSTDDFQQVTRGFAVMALTQYPNEDTRDRLVLILGKKNTQGKFVVQTTPDDPTRGFAALALGMYAQPYDTPSGPADRPAYDQALIALAERLDDPQDNLETRCACAVALGLSRRTEVLPVLIRSTQKLDLKRRATDELLFGFLLLGRALAGDRNLIEPATGLLVRQGDETSTVGILSRRAGVLALGVMKSGAVVPILTQAWHLNYYVNREVITALKLVGATGTAKPIIDRLRDSKDPKEQAYMAQALGELLAKEQPTRLTRLMAETNFTVRNDPIEPLKELANEFLFAYLIPCFGDTWK
jgi:HEAT repeat protein